MQEHTLHQLRDSLHAIRQGTLSVADFCRIWRAQSALLSALPSRFGEVMEDLLGRLEAGSLFTEESCSFSQIDLLATLDMWLDKAEQSLART
jgi:hypothetical protein